MMQINGITPVKQMQQPAIITPIQPVKPKVEEQEKKQEQIAQMAPQITAPMYAYPMQQMYAMPQQAMYPAAPQVPVMPVPVQQPVINKATVPVEKPQMPKAPVVTPTEALRAQALQPKVETKPAPELTKPEDVVIKAEENREKAVVEEKAVEKQEAAKKKPEIVAPEKIKPQIDLNGLIEILTSDNYDEQANAMEAIAQISKLAPEKADELLDVKVVDTLMGIMSQDTSKVPEADRKLAQRNKEYAMYTTAILQKVYADGVKKVANTDVPMEEVVGMAGIINELKNNENPETREAALASLSYVKRPEYNKDLKQLFAEASNDVSPLVKQRAQKELNTLA